jgi:hypothetical protein
MPLYDSDLNKYLHLGDKLNKDQIMTPEQRARIQALSQLSGHTDDFASGLTQDKTDPFTFDTGSLKTYSAMRGRDYGIALNDTPITLTNPDGSKQTRSMGDIKTDIDNARFNLENGQPTVNAQKFLSYAVPAYEAMKAQLDNQFQIGRHFNSDVKGKLPTKSGVRT